MKAPLNRLLERRSFMGRAAALAASGGIAPWALSLSHVENASAQSTGITGYRALVCIFLSGGNDGHNTVVPVDTASWRCYTGTRDPAVRAALTGTPRSGTDVSLALPRSSLLPISHTNSAGLNTGRSFALHPQLVRIRDLYSQRKAAIVANVGPLIQPTSKADLIDLSFPLPAKLYSHNDQQFTWQSFQTEGAKGGWGGRLMDKLASSNANPAFSSFGVNAISVWLAGNQVVPYQVGAGGVATMGGESGAIFGSAEVYKAVRQAAAQARSGNTFAVDYAKVVQRAQTCESALLQALAPTAAAAANDPRLRYINPNTGKSAVNSLATQLQMVARLIGAHANGQIGAKRQVFMVTLGGFDTHSDQMVQHADLMAKLDHGIDYFYNALAVQSGGSQLSSQVTTFTASEFGRQLVNNGDGTDHGWGSHHFVIGGSVKGGEVYGRYPKFLAFNELGNFFSDNLIDYGGALLPEISVDQMVYTLGKWMGVSVADLIGAQPGQGIAPNIQNFDPNLRDIGFMA